ncbi:hypothetical protein G6F50_018725 [Rhizopus delemar]|uniref:Uncharacterized protein n=1 Tax=Rhizopus delemar TaxID=936053 RepID=A0A9P7BY65_9FUNG|nr:hypothetical protein G6F50_018725 [Rhizopus delemar]
MPQHHHRTDQHDAGDEVGTRHQRGVQDHRHPRNDHVAGNGGQHEDVQRYEPVTHWQRSRSVFVGPS